MKIFTLLYVEFGKLIQMKVEANSILYKIKKIKSYFDSEMRKKWQQERGAKIRKIKKRKNERGPLFMQVLPPFPPYFHAYFLSQIKEIISLSSSLDLKKVWWEKMWGYCDDLTSYSGYDQGRLCGLGCPRQPGEKMKLNNLTLLSVEPAPLVQITKQPNRMSCDQFCNGSMYH